PCEAGRSSKAPSWRRRKPSAAPSSSAPTRSNRRSRSRASVPPCISRTGSSRCVQSRRSRLLEAPSARHIALERAFRAAHGRLIAALMRRFGAAQLALLESAVQEAGLRALEKWNDDSESADLEGWLLRVAHNGVVDALRRDQRSVPVSEHHLG